MGVLTSLLARLVEHVPGLRSRRGKAVEHPLHTSPLFDRGFYLERYPDVAAAGGDPALHYLTTGWKELRDPSAAFSTACYLLDHPDVAHAGVNPLVHFLNNGSREDRIYRPSSASAAAIDVLSSGIDAECRAIRASGLFDEAYYLALNDDIDPPPIDPIRHYCEHGWREGRNPSEDFDSGFYLEAYADIRECGINPFYHYVIAGRAEQRRSIPDGEVAYEDDVWFGGGEPDVRLIAFHTVPDWQAIRRQRAVFQGHVPPCTPHKSIGAYHAADPLVLDRQARMARHHGLCAFCFELHIDMAGGSPLATFLATRDIAFGLCVRVVPQSDGRIPALAAAIAAAWADPRYVRIGSRPIVLIVTPRGCPDADTFTVNLRRALAKCTGMEAFLVLQGDAGLGPRAADAALDLPLVPVPRETGPLAPRVRDDVDVVPYGEVAFQGVRRAREAGTAAFPVWPVVSLARAVETGPRGRPLAYTRFEPYLYRRWIDAAIVAARGRPEPERRFVIVESWNDWAAGIALEPDRQSGFARLNETSRALRNLASAARMPKVSVIVPNGNHEPFLRRRLDSIYGQTYTNIEVLLLDDGLNDGRRAVFDEYATAHPEITRTLDNAAHSGAVFSQWARGIKAATGELVWIADSAGDCDERFLESLVRCFDDEAVLLAHTRPTFVDHERCPTDDAFTNCVGDLECAGKWDRPHVETAHNEVTVALGTKNTIWNASGVLFRRPVDLPLLDDPAWLAMRFAGDWVFYLYVARGGRIAFTNEVTNRFHRRPGNAAEQNFDGEAYFREMAMASRTVATLYNVPLSTLERCRERHLRAYWQTVGRDEEEFHRWFDYPSILRARERRMPNVMICTAGFYPGGAEILPIRLAHEFRRRGLSVLMLSAGLHRRQGGVRRMLRSDIPLVETSLVEATRDLMRDFGIECLNSHQWHIQKYPALLPDVFDALCGHVASLHGMIEHGNAVTAEELRVADTGVTTWVYTADKNLEPFREYGLFQADSPRFTKIPNGLEPQDIVPIPRHELGLPEDAFVLCCVSRAIPEKGWAEAIETVSRARVLSGRDIRLVLVGNGPVHDEYYQRGVPAFVCLVGFSENSVGHYAAADMGIMLTTFKSESFPLTIVDCLFAGKPYIASDIGDIRSMLTTAHGMAGAVVELPDWAIPVDEAARLVAAFATDEALYARAQARVGEAVGRFHIGAVAEQYIRLFVESVGRGSQGSRRSQSVRDAPPVP
jgi:glycosyltransferase involved in cell wall biosynthesis